MTVGSNNVVKHRLATALRILCLGGSTTYGYLLEDDETWPAMLEQRLVDSGYDVEVINAGVSWQTSAQGLISYVLDGRFYQPDIVIAMYATSDLARSFPLPGEPPFERDYGSYQGPMRRMLRLRSGAENDKGPMAWLLSEPPALYRLACQVTRIDQMYYRSLREALAGPIEPTSVDMPTTVDVALDGFPSIGSHRENLAYLVRLCEADGRRILLATEPNLFDCPDAADQPIDLRDALGAMVSRRGLAAAMEVCRQSLFDIAQESGAVVVDAERAVGELVDNFIDGIHFAPQGNRLVAEAFLPLVAGIFDELTSARHAVAAPHGTGSPNPPTTAGSVDRHHHNRLPLFPPLVPFPRRFFRFPGGMPKPKAPACYPRSAWRRYAWPCHPTIEDAKSRTTFLETVLDTN